MTEQEYQEKLARYDLNDRKLCTFIFNETGAVIKDKHIRDYFKRSTRLSEPMTGLIRAMFNKLEVDLHERRTA